MAIQIKTNAAFEGLVFGLWLLIAEWQRRRRFAAVTRIASEFAALALMPTLLALGIYLALGHGEAWWQANVLSILAKGAPRDGIAVRSFWETAILFAPAGLLALIGLRARTARFTVWTSETLFLIVWGAIATVDFAAIGGFYPHYAIPLLLAVSPLIAHAFAIQRWGAVLALLALVWPVAHATVFTPRIAARERGYARDVVAALPRDLSRRCLFVYEGPVAYYRLTNACRLTRFAFSAHLSSIREAPSLGVDPGTEIRRIMALRPGTVMTVEHSSWPDRSPAMERLMARELARNYALAARLPHRYYAPEERLLVWRRR